MITQLTEAAETVLKRRYYLKDEDGNCIEDWPALCKRVAKHVANGDEELEEEFFWMMNELYFLPNSPCLMNSGTDIGNLSACFVLPIEDSMEGIFDAIKWGATVHKTGGGTGYSFSNLRGKNSPVKSTAGVASGPVSFAEVFNAATETIKQGGRRRGANMGVLHVDHPDIEEFITVKSDPSKLTNFNLSVAITDEFMEKVKEGDSESRRIFDLIVDRAHASGEPGLICIDAANRANPTPHLGKYETTNPCQPYWTPVIKKGFGIVMLGEIKVGDEIWSKEGWTTVLMHESTGTKDVFSYSTTAGTFYSTQDHEIVSLSEKISVCDAEAIDTCVGSPLLTSHNMQDVVDGLVIGDGTKHGRGGDKVMLLVIGEKDQDYHDIFPEFIGNEYSKSGTFKVQTTITPEELPQTFDRFIPERFVYSSLNKMAGFLKGLFSANGTVIYSPKTKRVQLKATSRAVIEQVQIMLSALGIRSYTTTNKSKDIKFSNGTYTCKESYDINITSDIDVFYNSIGFLQKYKSDKLKDIVDNRRPSNRVKVNYSIYNSQYVSSEEVYHITVDNQSHTYWSFGFDTGNCGEQFLLPFNSCSLGSINLTKFVKKVAPRTDDRDWPNNDFEIDYYLLDKVVRLSTIFLDKTLDINKFPLPQIDRETKKTRNIGLGIMGLHDLLIKLKIPYASERGLSKAAEVMSSIKRVALNTSEEMASVDGAFPAFIPGSYPPRKNANLTTCAPTGTISMVANCSSGMEPNFGYVMVKNVMDSDHLLMVNSLFESIARDEGFYSEELMKKVSETGSVKHSEIPEYWQQILYTAQDITPEWHVKMQAAIQNNGNDSGTSKTVNLPESATKKDIEDIYMLAWDLGCKGVTVYRQNSRQNQVLNTVGNLEKQTATVNTSGPVKADLPDTLRARRYKVKLDEDESLYIIICFDEGGKPMEVFAKFPHDNQIQYREKNTMYTVTCRLISLGLRYGIPVEDIIKQLDKSSGSMFDLPAQLTKLLKMFLSETDKPYSTPCPECGGSQLVFKEGCQMCESCGYSKCS